MKRAEEARENAYAPYSKYKVGAAVLTDSGAIFTGCNVENASYGATICAERVAILSAVAAGEQKIIALALCTPNSATPCGMCLQVLCEFAASDASVVADGRHFLLKELLPAPFEGVKKL